MFPNATVYKKMPTQFIIINPERDIADWDDAERQFATSSTHYHLFRKLNDIEIYERI